MSSATSYSIAPLCIRNEKVDVSVREYESTRNCTLRVDYQLFEYTDPSSEVTDSDCRYYSLILRQYENGILTTTSAVHDLTRRKDLAFDFFDMIVRNIVTPTTIHDIVEDSIFI